MFECLRIPQLEHESLEKRNKVESRQLEYNKFLSGLLD